MSEFRAGKNSSVKDCCTAAEHSTVLQDVAARGITDQCYTISSAVILPVVEALQKSNE